MSLHEELVQLAMDSNNYYGYRSITDEQAKNLFAIKPGDIIYCLRNDDDLIGFYGLRAPHELSHLFLKPAYIKQGYGKKLFNKAIVHAQSLGWPKLEWESDPFSAVFYDKMGAKRIGENICPLNPLYRSPVFYMDIRIQNKKQG